MSDGRIRVAFQSWLAARDPVARPLLSRRNAVALALLVYAGVFGPAVYQAIELYRGQNEHNTRISLAGAAISVTCEALIAIVAGLAIIRYLAGNWRPVLGAAPWRRELVAGSLFVTLIWISAWLMRLVPHHHFPAATTPAGHLGDAIGFLRSGPLEEICALLTPLIVLRAGRVPWPGVFVLLVAMRLSYHLYYGVGAVVVALWAFGTVLIYLWARSIVGLAIAHSLYDLTILPNELGHPVAAGLLHLLLILFCLVISVRFGWRLARRRHRARQRAAKQRADVLSP